MVNVWMHPVFMKIEGERSRAGKLDRQLTSAEHSEEEHCGQGRESLRMITRGEEKKTRVEFIAKTFLVKKTAENDELQNVVIGMTL